MENKCLWDWEALKSFLLKGSGTPRQVFLTKILLKIKSNQGASLSSKTIRLSVPCQISIILSSGGAVGVGGGPQTNIKGSGVNQEARQMYALVSWVRQSYQLSEIYHYKSIPLSVFNVKHYSVLGWHYKSLGTFCNGRSCARPIVILIMIYTKWNY